MSVLTRRSALGLLAASGAGLAAGLANAERVIASEAPEPSDVPGAEPRLFDGGGVFVWHEAALHTEGKRAVLNLMIELGLTEVYLYVPADTKDARVGRFMASAQRRGIEVYLLAGNPAWSLDPSGEAIAEQVRRAARYGMRGVVVDVEPHMLDTWDDGDRARLDLLWTYAEAMVHTREAAEAQGLELAACIPFYYDGRNSQGSAPTLREELDYGVEGLIEGGVQRAIENGRDLDFNYEVEVEYFLNYLVAEGCHRLMVMNYFKRDEMSQVAVEERLCELHGRPLTVIYELQPVGTHGLESYNTYHDDGLEAVRASFDRVAQGFPEGDVTIALHDGETLVELVGAAAIEA